MAKRQRPEVPDAIVDRIDGVLRDLPHVVCEAAWVGTRWQVQGATIAHVFGGEDQLFRVVLRGEPDEVMAFQHLGPPYFRAEWGANVIGLVLDGDTDWVELTELLTDSYCVVAPVGLAARVARPQ